MNRLYELWQENVAANGEEVWSPLALGFAKKLLRATARSSTPFSGISWKPMTPLPSIPRCSMWSVNGPITGSDPG
jgi:hypothetical protein